MTTGGYYSKLLHMDKKTKIWIAVLFSVVLLGLLGFFALSHLGGGTIAVITVDGQEFRRIDLSRVTESYDIEIDTKYGHNTVHVAPGRIAVTQADCPDGICVRARPAQYEGDTIVCLPNKTEIRIEGAASADIDLVS